LCDRWVVAIVLSVLSAPDFYFASCEAGFRTRRLRDAGLVPA